MEFAAAQQPLRDVGGLNRRALGGRMSCKIARHCDQDVPALVGAPSSPNCLARPPASGRRGSSRALQEQRVRESAIIAAGG